MTLASNIFDYGALTPPQAKELRAAAENIRSRSATITAAIIENGGYFLAAKRALRHGQFSQWVEVECGFTLRTAQNHMSVARFAYGKSETVSLLTPSSIYALASKAAPLAVVHRVSAVGASFPLRAVYPAGEARGAKAERFSAQTGEGGNGTRTSREHSQSARSLLRLSNASHYASSSGLELCRLRTNAAPLRP
jgi:hypothetical protein